MDDYAWVKIQLKTSASGGYTKVDIFEIQEVSFVHKANGVEYFALY